MLIKIGDIITFGFKYACIKLAQVDIKKGITCKKSKKGW
jgi:hypothetical protein